MVQLPLFSEKGVYKFFSIENLEILHSFSQADVLDRDTEMIRNTDHDATFGRRSAYREAEDGFRPCFGGI